MQKDSNKKIAYFCFNALGRPFNEAWRNEIRALSKEIGATVITRGHNNHKLIEKFENYISFDKNRPPSFLPLATGINHLLFLMFAKKYEKKYDIIILEGSPNCWWLFKMLTLEKCIHEFRDRSWFDRKSFRMYIKYIAPKLKAIIVPSEEFKHRFINLGITPDKIFVLLPGINLKKFKPTHQKKNNQQLKILFASAPTTGKEYKTKFEERGLFELLDAIKEFSKTNKCKITIVWRGVFSKEITKHINKIKINRITELINKPLKNMEKIYSKNDLVVLTPKRALNIPEYPLSLVEALACGKPVLTSRLLKISTLVEKECCGITCEVKSNEIVNALKEFQRNYYIYQKNARKTAEKYFDLEKKKEALMKYL